MTKLKSAVLRYLQTPYLAFFTLPVFVYLIIESLSQQSVLGAFVLLFKAPHIVLLNLIIVCFTYCAVLFVKRRIFVYSLVTFIWIALGVTNFILLGMRNSPFCATDLLIFRYGFIISARYMGALEIILIIIGILGIPAVFVILFRKGKKYDKEIEYKTSAVITAVIFLICLLLVVLGVSTGFLKTRYNKPKYDYTHYGLPYSFLCSIFVQGVEKPDDYSDTLIGKIVESIDMSESDPVIKPNIVLIQLESFFDVDRLNFPIGNDPIPTFHEMCRNNPSGSLEVHTLGGGTSNTEFEVLTGMDLEFFGTVEFPYESFVDDKTCESIAYDLKREGYQTDAIHTFSAGFYNRNNVYSNLGFDTFTSFEYMTNLEYNELGWVKDSVLARYVLKAINTSSKPDFVFGVSVQGHGSYPTDFSDEAIVSVPDYDYNADIAHQIEYYVSQLRETDQMLAFLTDELEKCGEPTVLVLYGDHIPGIQLSENMVEGGLYNTEYVIWSNFDLEGEDKDICAYQLTSHVLDLLEIHPGVLTNYHQQFADRPDYLDNLKTLEYDIVNGDRHTYDGIDPYEPTHLRLGIDVIEPHYVKQNGSDLYVYGTNFNEFTTVYINDSRRSTKYISPECVMVENAELSKNDTVGTAQKDYQNMFNMLSFSKKIVCK